MAVLQTVSASVALFAVLAVGEDACARQALVALTQASADRLPEADFPTKYVRCRLAVVREVPVNGVVLKVAEYGRVARLGPCRAGRVVGGGALAFW